MTDILDRLQPIFREVLDQPSLSVDRSSNAHSVEGWDSLAHINLIAAIEDDFSVRFALGELQDLKNVGDLVDLIQQKRG